MGISLASSPKEISSFFIVHSLFAFFFSLVAICIFHPSERGRAEFADTPTMFYETAQTIGPGWHGKSFKPSHYDDMSWTNPTSAARHFRSPGSSPTLRRRIIDYDNDDDDSEPHMFQRKSPNFERKFFKDVWNDHPRREEFFEDRPSLFKRTTKRDWDKDMEDFENLRRRERDYRNDFDEQEDETDAGSTRIHHIPIMVERRRERMSDDKPFRTRCSSPPPPPPPSSLEQDHFVDESDEWLRHHMDRLKQNFDSGFSTMQSRNRHRLPRVDLNCRPRAFTSPIPDWGPDNVHTLPTRKLHSKILDEKRNPKSVFRSYSETHEDVPREHPTASRSHSDSHCPKTAYVTKVPVNTPEEKAEEPKTNNNEEEACRPEPPRRRARCRARKDGNVQETEQDKKNSESSTPDTPSEADVPKTECKRKNSCKDSRGANALLQITAVLQNVEDLFHHVEAYNGNGSDKQFRFLDEMLTRCMLRLDDVDTDGLDDVRTARKAAVHKVQACIEKLESRASGGSKKNDSNNEESKSDENSEEKATPDEEPKPCSDAVTNDASTNEEAEQTRL